MEQIQQLHQLVEDSSNLPSLMEEQFKSLTDEQQKYLICERIITLASSLSEHDEFLQSICKKAIHEVIKDSSVPITKLEADFLMTATILKRQNQEALKEVDESLKSIFRTYNELGQELQFSQVIDRCYFFTYLLWNGYFSCTKEHAYDLKNRFRTIFGMEYLDILKGTGVCLQYADALSRFLQEGNIESDLLICKVASDSLQNMEYYPNIHRTIKNAKMPFWLNNFFGSFLSETVGNHAITLIRDNGQYFAYDPTNLVAFNFDSYDTVSCATGDCHYDLKWFSTFLVGNTDEKLYNDFLFSKLSCPIEKKELIEHFQNVISTCEDYRYLLDENYHRVFLGLNDAKQMVLQKRKDGSVISL